MNVRVDAAGGDDFAFAGDGFGSGPYNNGDIRLHVGIASFAYRTDAAILDGDIRLYDPPVIENQRVGDDTVHGTLTARAL